MENNMADKKSFNYLALRGAPVDDMEFVEQFGLDPSVAYTDKINEAMLDITYDQNIASGIDKDTAAENRANSRKDLNLLFASKGMLK